MKKPTHQNLKKDTAYVYLGHFLRYISPLILVPYYSHVLGPEGYGRVLAALSLTTLVSSIVTYGFLYSGIRDVATSRSEEERARIIGKQIMGRILLCPIVALVGVAATLFSPVLHENLWYGAWATLLGILYAYSFSWFFQGLRQFKTSVFLDSLIYPLNILFVISMVRGPADGVYALAGLFCAALLHFAISFSFLLKKTKIKIASFTEGIKEIRDTTVFFITSMNFMIVTAGSTYILSLMVPAEAVGYYGTAEKFVSLAMGLLYPIGQVLMPAISSLHKDGSGHAYALVKKSVTLEVIYGVAGLFGGILIAPIAMPLILGDKFASSVYLFQLMLIILPFAAIRHALVLYLLVPLHEEKYYMRAAIVSVTLNLICALFFVPLWGAEGMVWARIVSELSLTTVVLFYVKKLKFWTKLRLA